MSTGLRIMMATSELPPDCGGIGWYVHYLIAELRKRGVKVTPVIRASPLGRSSASREEPLRVPASNLPFLGPRGFSRGMRKLSGMDDVDLVVVHGAHLGGWGLGKPVLLVTHMCLAEGNIRFHRGSRQFPDIIRRLLDPLLRRVEGYSIRRATLVGAVSQSMVEDIRIHHGVEGIYLGNGVDVERFSPAHGKPAPARGVLFVSMFKHGKGMRDILEIIRKVRGAGCDVPFCLIGRGPMENWFRTRLEGRGIGGVTVRPYANHNDLPQVYREHSMVLLPSYYEGLPTVVLEAMASGLPVIATDAGGTREALVNGETGFCFPVGDVEGMAEAIIRIDADPALARRLGDAGLARIKEHLSWSSIGDLYMDTFRTMLERQSLHEDHQRDQNRTMSQ